MSARTSDGVGKSYVLDITPADSFDLSTVTAATFEVRGPGGTVTTWDATLTNKTTSTLRLTHAYEANVFPTAGTYVIYAVLTYPSGTLNSSPRTLHVLDAYDTSVA